MCGPALVKLVLGWFVGDSGSINSRKLSKGIVLAGTVWYLY